MAPQCLWGKSISLLRSGFFPLPRPHLSSPTPHSSHVKPSSIPSLCLALSGVYAQWPLWLRQCLRPPRHSCSSTGSQLHTHLLSLTPKSGWGVSPLSLNSLLPGPLLTVLGVFHYLLASLLEGKCTRQGLCHLAYHCVSCPNTVSPRDKPQWRFIALSRTQEAT